MNELTEEERNRMFQRANHDNFYTEFHKRSGTEDDIYYFEKNTKRHVGSGYIPKDGERKGKICIVRCPACQRENYHANVSSGFCTWCPFNANGDND